MVSDIRFRGAAEPTQAKSDNTGEIQMDCETINKEIRGSYGMGEKSV